MRGGEEITENGSLTTRPRRKQHGEQRIWNVWNQGRKECKKSPKEGIKYWLGILGQ